MTKMNKPGADEALDTAAQGHDPTSDEGEEDADGEIETMGEAAGIPMPEGAVLGGDDPIEKRDAHRWELDPASAEDVETRDP